MLPNFAYSSSSFFAHHDTRMIPLQTACHTKRKGTSISKPGYFVDRPSACASSCLQSQERVPIKDRNVGSLQKLGVATREILRHSRDTQQQSFEESCHSKQSQRYCHSEIHTLIRWGGSASFPNAKMRQEESAFVQGRSSYAIALIYTAINQASERVWLIFKM